MKKLKFFIILLGLFITNLSMSQNLDLPRFYIVNRDTMGIILSMDQMKKIKNDLELKSYFESAAISCDSFIMKQIIVVDDYEKKIKSLKARITKLDSTDAQRRVLLDNCLERLGNDESNKNICDLQRKNDSLIINNLNKEITTLKTEKLFGWMGSGTFLLTSIILGVILALH